MPPVLCTLWALPVLLVSTADTAQLSEPRQGPGLPVRGPFGCFPKVFVSWVLVRFRSSAAPLRVCVRLRLASYRPEAQPPATALGFCLRVLRSSAEVSEAGWPSCSIFLLPHLRFPSSSFFFFLPSHLFPVIFDLHRPSGGLKRLAPMFSKPSVVGSPL